MRFAALQGGSARDYAAAGTTVAREGAKSFEITRKHSPSYDEIAKTAMKTRSNEKVVAMDAGAHVAKAGIKAVGNVKETALREQGKDKIRQIGSKMRKAGAIAALGGIAGAGYLASKDNTEGREIPTNTDAKRDLWNKHMEGLRAKNAERDAERTEYKPTTSSANSSSSTDGSSSGGGSAGKVTTGGGGTSLSGQAFDMSKLTTKDYDDLAFAISSEAQLGTDDEYGVAANILTRLKSGKYGGNVNSIIHAPGQYEGVYTGRSVASPQISARLQSPEGQKKIQDFIQRLDGRTEFKGQSMLHNRVAAEDPMFSDGGNFYHYAGQ